MDSDNNIDDPETQPVVPYEQWLKRMEDANKEPTFRQVRLGTGKVCALDCKSDVDEIFLDEREYWCDEAQNVDAPVVDSRIMWRFKSIQRFSDWTIVVNGKAQYRVHRAFLAGGPRKSGYFAALFQSSNSNVTEYQEQTSRIDGLDVVSAPLIETVLDFIHTGETGDVKRENLPVLFSLADYFDVPTLKRHIFRMVAKDTIENGMQQLVFYLTECEANDNCKPLYDFCVRNCCGYCISPELAISLRPKWLLDILEADIPPWFLEPYEKSSMKLPCPGSRLVPRCLLAQKPEDLNKDIVNALVACVSGKDISPKNAVRLLSVIDSFSWEGWDDNSLLYSELCASCAAELEHKNPDSASGGGGGKLGDDESHSSEMQNYSEELIQAEEKIEQMDCDSLFDEKSMSSECSWDETGRQFCVKAIVNAWDVLCDESDQEIAGLMSKLDGNLLLAMMRKAKSQNKTNNTDSI